jgi:hypothetical protein
MNIELLTYLRDNPKEYPQDPDPNDQWPNRGLSLETITAFEMKYNNGNPFPKVLKELLYLAGEFCYVLAYDNSDTMEEMQDRQRQFFIDYNVPEFTRPFFVLDLYNFGDGFTFMYLDDGDNPPLFYFDFEENKVYNLNSNLVEWIKEGIDRVKAGGSPF